MRPVKKKILKLLSSRIALGKSHKVFIVKAKSETTLATGSRIKTGDVVKVIYKGVIGYGQLGRVLSINNGVDDTLRVQPFGRLTDNRELPHYFIEVQLDDFKVKYSESCLEKVKDWRSIDDE